MTNTLYYFGYGSNLFVPRITARISSTRKVATAAVNGYQLRFNKQGHDGSAKANMCKTGDSSDLIRGAIYAMDANQKSLLDQIEGVETDGGYTPPTKSRSIQTMVNRLMCLSISPISG